MQCDHTIGGRNHTERADGRVSSTKSVHGVSVGSLRDLSVVMKGGTKLLVG